MLFWAAFQEISANRCMKLQEENQIDVNIFNGELVNETIQSAEETITVQQLDVPRMYPGGIATVTKP